MVEFKDYYQILGVSRGATEKEIKSAFRKLARTYHPDVNPGADAKFKEINEAYEVLGDPQKRQRYDSLGANWRGGSNFEPPPGFDGMNINFGDMGGFGSGFSDFFDMIFGQMGAGGPHPHQRNVDFGQAGFGRTGHRGQPQPKDLDVYQTLDVSLADWFAGEKKNVLIGLPNGQTRHLSSVKIPRGILPGQKIRLAGEGLSERGQRGNLLLTLHLMPDTRFTVEGKNLIYEAVVSIPDLALGTEVTVPTMQGNVTLKIPERTEPGKRLKVKGRGLPGKTEADHGDLLVKLKARFPETLTPEARTHFEALRELLSPS